ncbi:MAG TPA: ATP-binding cassette domain-containing protein, partial [Cytophagaceae bacterium]
MNIITCNKVGKKYEGHVALHDVSLEIKEGIIFGLIGPNGAGKTSLIRIITQILGYDSGEIYFRNQLLDSSHSKLIGYLPEERGLYKKMKVGEQLIYFAKLKGLSASDAKREVDNLLEKFGLSSWKEKFVEELSKGMQQKVQFIATVVHKPELVILDEPFSGFDPINAEVLKTEIQEMKSHGQSIIFSTHRMESVDELCDEIALINKGHKILEGSVKDV